MSGEEIEFTSRTIQNVPSPHYTSVYANNVALALNFFDLSMVFGEMVDIKETVLTVEQKVRVTMPPSHAKLFLLLLKLQIEQYEEKFGQIVLPPDVVQPELRRILREETNED